MRLCISTLLSFALVLSTGCGLVGGPSRFEVSDVYLDTRGETLSIRVSPKLQLSPAARRAMHNGVPLVLRLSVETLADGTVTPLATREESFEVRYLPMSERYELFSPERNERRTYPRLRHVLRRLGQVTVRFEDVTLAEGNYLVRTRLYLDRSSLPAPMQLPSVVYRTWRHDSDWTQWRFRISA